MITFHLYVAIAVMLVYGFAGEARRLGTIAILQIAVSDEQRGRLMSTQFMLQRFAGGISTVLVGFIAEENGLRAPMLVAVGLALAAWSVAFVYRKGIVGAFQ